MQITTVTISRTVNLGNFNSLKLEVSAELDDDDVATVVRERLGDWLLEQIAEEAPPPPATRRLPRKEDPLMDL